MARMQDMARRMVDVNEYGVEAGVRRFGIEAGEAATIAKKSPLTRRQRGSAVNPAPIGNSSRSCHSITS